VTSSSASKIAATALLHIAGAFALAMGLADCSVAEVCIAGEPGCSTDPCDNGLLDGSETDVDCGGSCGPCESGAACELAEDCGTGRCLDGACCEAPCAAWGKTFGDVGFDLALSAVVSSDGSVVVTGQFSGTVDFGGGARASLGEADGFVAAYDREGTFLYDLQFGGSGHELAPRLALGPDDQLWLGFISTSRTLTIGATELTGGGGYGDLFLLELGPEGSVMQAHTYSTHGAGLGLSDIEATPDGGVIITASMSRFDFGDGVVYYAGPGMDILLAKLDASGGREWSHQFGGSDDLFVYSLALAEDAIYLDAIYRGANATLGGQVLPDTAAGIDFACAVAKFGLDGAHIWSRPCDVGTGGGDILVDDDGNVFITGLFHGKVDFGSGPVTAVGTHDMYLARLDPSDGRAVWTLRAGDNYAYGRGLASDGRGSVLFAAQVTGEAVFDGGVSAGVGVDSLLLGRVSNDGVVEWVADARGIFVNGNISLLYDRVTGQGIALGGYAGTIALGDQTLASAGKLDAFLLSFLP
jgi:hypothetical protein